MRKVLLATTALVAVTGVASADVSISAYSEAHYTDISMIKLLLSTEH